MPRAAAALAQLGVLAGKCAAWPPRTMPVRQPWVESVLASGGYGSHSIQRGIYFLSLRAGQRARHPAAAAARRRYSSVKRTVHLVGRRHAMMLLYFHVLGQSGS